ncbi:hypothetical protein BJY52DRAFT_771484 [Lactarius psammicola]|nr:hypothetical protein BJY52DRAFT_771484 [Lactarius psammicola]
MYPLNKGAETLLTIHSFMNHEFILASQDSLPGFRLEQFCSLFIKTSFGAQTGAKVTIFYRRYYGSLEPRASVIIRQGGAQEVSVEERKLAKWCLGDGVKSPDMVSGLLKRAHRPNTLDAYMRPFIPVLKDIPHPSRGLSSSIWAPQPHPTEASWQKAITSFSQTAEDKSRMRPDDKRGTAFTAPDRDEDVFGPIDFLCGDNKKDVGAIGDGRKRASPDTVNNHIEQLLRALDLNSPIPLCASPASWIAH